MGAWPQQQRVYLLSQARSGTVCTCKLCDNFVEVFKTLISVQMILRNAWNSGVVYVRAMAIVIILHSIIIVAVQP
jgi:hypothetical protein